MILLSLVLAMAAFCIPIGAEAAIHSAVSKGCESIYGDVRVVNPAKRGINTSSDDIRNPLKREKMRMERRGLSTFQHQETSRKYVGPPTYKVTCVFEGESHSYFAIYRPGFFEETYSSVWDEMENVYTFVFEVPAGTYDVCSEFYGEVNGFHGPALIVHEDIEINNDITISFSADEATEVQRIRPVLRNGEGMKLPIGTFIEEEPWVELDETEANANFVYYDYMVFCEGCESLQWGYKDMNFCPVGETSDFYRITNPISDKYHTILYSYVLTSENEYDISTTDITGFSNRVVNTYDKDFVKMPIARFVDTPLFFEEGCEYNRLIVRGEYWIDNVRFGGGGLYMPTIDPHVYVTSQPSDKFDLKTVIGQISVQMEKTEIVEEIREDGQIVTFEFYNEGLMAALPAWYNDGKWNYINQNHTKCHNALYQRPVEGPMVEYPGLEPYCFTSKEIAQPFGNSSPILVPLTQVIDWDGSMLIDVVPQAWIGRYGEVRNCDNWTVTSKILDGNGTILFDNRGEEYMDDWMINYFTNPHAPGLLKYEIVDTNILIDGTIPGFNSTTLEIDETRYDKCAPTPQMLIFKNPSGTIIDRFKSAEEGIIEFSAGDFNLNQTVDNWYFTVDEAEVLVEYAPYGDETWQPIEVEEVPEYFYMPGFGYFYRGSLGCVDQPSSNGWYDLRMTLTDKAGNRTVEHISPAFKIGEGSGVKSTPVGGVNVWVADGQLRTNCPEVASIEVFTLDGRLIAKTGGSSLSSLSVDGLTGALLVRLTTPSGTVSTHKLLL